MHRTTSRFWKCLEKLPYPIRKVAEKNIRLLKENSGHPSLNFKKVGKIWSVRIGNRYRALAVEDGTNFIWVWIGNRDEYERMIMQITNSE